MNLGKRKQLGDSSDVSLVLVTEYAPGEGTGLPWPNRKLVQVNTEAQTAWTWNVMAWQHLRVNTGTQGSCRKCSHCGRQQGTTEDVGKDKSCEAYVLDKTMEKRGSMG